MISFWTSVHFLTGMEISEFPNISFEHPRGGAFCKYRSQTLAPVQFINRMNEASKLALSQWHFSKENPSKMKSAEV